MRIYVPQGEYAVASGADDRLTSILGSCVATCLYDESAGVGGMNHILLPHDANSAPPSDLQTLNLMELLINALMKEGADRARLKGKLFGGARMTESQTAIGQMNVSFARQFLEDEGIPCLAESLGGNKGRKIRFWPATGRVRQFILGRHEIDETEVRREHLRVVPDEQPKPPDIELF